MKNELTPYNDLISTTWKKIQGKIDITSDIIKDTMPFTTKDGVYDNHEYDSKDWWTNTFWAGILWYMYKGTQRDKYKEYAESIEEKMDEVLFGYDNLHHDVGFMWLTTSVMNYEITNNEKSRQRALLAASVLSSRYNISGGFIRAWNGPYLGRAIIDCMMNIPLLYWASKYTEDNRFAQVADSHAITTMKHFVRDNGSVNHIVDFEVTSGMVLDKPGGQGYESGSAWSRGQAWALYGFISCYKWTRQNAYLDTAKSIADYIIGKLREADYLVPCDYLQPESSTLLDSSAAAITLSGLIQLAECQKGVERSYYIEEAMKILSVLNEKSAIWDLSDQALLTDGTSRYHETESKWYVKNGALIYGDYYFVESVYKLNSILKSEESDSCNE